MIACTSVEKCILIAFGGMIIVLCGLGIFFNVRYLLRCPDTKLRNMVIFKTGIKGFILATYATTLGLHYEYGIETTVIIWDTTIVFVLLVAMAIDSWLRDKL